MACVCARLIACSGQLDWSVWSDVALAVAVNTVPLCSSNTCVASVAERMAAHKLVTAHALVVSSSPVNSFYDASKLLLALRYR